MEKVVHLHLSVSPHYHSSILGYYGYIYQVISVNQPLIVSTRKEMCLKVIVTLSCSFECFQSSQWFCLIGYWTLRF